MTTAEFQRTVAALQKSGALPRSLSDAQLRALQQSLAKYADDISAEKLKQILDGIKTRVESILQPQQVLREGEVGSATRTVTEGLTQGAANSQLTALLSDLGAKELADRVGFMLDVALKVSGGAGKFIQQNADPEVVDLYPALELERFYDREVPRGLRQVKDALVPVPEEDWPSRWSAAADESGDEEAARILDETGRMVALKDSGIWQALGDGAGGYDDALGNPFPPFAFNSGYATSSVSRADAEELGLLDPGEKAAGAAMDFGKLFNLEAAA